jgi:hypothetical protein
VGVNSAGTIARRASYIEGQEMVGVEEGFIYVTRDEKMRLAQL